MYLRILEGFPSHWKTLALARKLDDHNAGMYCLRLWTWACQSAPSGDLSNIDPLDIELIVHWPGEPGRCFAAMVAVRLIDRREDGGHEIHEWADHTGGDIEKMETRAAEKRADAAERKRRERERKAAGEAGHTGHAPVTRDIGVTVTPCHDPRQGKARQDETRQDKPPSANPDARAGDPTATAATPGPVALAEACALVVEQAGEVWTRETVTELVLVPPQVTGYGVPQLFGRIRAECLPGCLPWDTPGGQALQKADRFVAGLPPDRVALLEPSMRLFFEQAQDHTARPPPDPRLQETGFGFGAWLHRFPDLCEQLLGARRPAKQLNPRDAAFLRSVQGEA
jgi:hypothetical protein